MVDKSLWHVDDGTLIVCAAILVALENVGIDGEDDEDDCDDDNDDDHCNNLVSVFYRPSHFERG